MTEQQTMAMNYAIIPHGALLKAIGRTMPLTAPWTILMNALAISFGSGQPMVRRQTANIVTSPLHSVLYSPYILVMEKQGSYFEPGRHQQSMQRDRVTSSVSGDRTITSRLALLKMANGIRPLSSGMIILPLKQCTI